MNLEDKILELRQLYPFDLLMHGPEDEGKTEDATDHRKRKARDTEGRVFLTQELPQAMGLLGSMTFLFALSSYYSQSFMALFHRFFQDYFDMDITLDNMGIVTQETIFFIIKLFLPIGLISMIMGVFFSVIQTNFFFSTVPLQLKWDKISLSWNNFQNKTIFSQVQVINLVKTMIKVIFIMVVGYYYVYDAIDELKVFVNKPLYESFIHMGFSVYVFTMIVGLFFLLLALPDWYVQKMEYERNLKMSIQEIKQEYKELEGDPMIKSKIRARARELATQDMMANVPDADVIVTNPTHYSCAIKYKYGEMDAPKLIAKGKDLVALKIREIAKENNIPLIENKPLARGIYANVDIDEFIPMEYYGAVAEILSALEKYKGTGQ